jgi:stearoyl-CoA desaturase (delta-9 desaturase)
MAVLSFGEAFHNNHHQFPTSARAGLEWWEFDLCWLFIRGLELLGLAWDVKVPSKRERALAPRTSQAGGEGAGAELPWVTAEIIIRPTVAAKAKAA